MIFFAFSKIDIGGVLIYPKNRDLNGIRLLKLSEEKSKKNDCSVRAVIFLRSRMFQKPLLR